MLGNRMDSPRRSESPRHSVPALLPYTLPLRTLTPRSTRVFSPKPGINGSGLSPRIAQKPSDFSAKPPKSARSNPSEHQEGRSYGAGYKPSSRELSPTAGRPSLHSSRVSLRSDSPGRFSSPRMSNRSVSPASSQVNAGEILARLKGTVDGEGMAAIVNDATHTISLGMGSHKLRQLRNEIFCPLGPREVLALWKYESEICTLHRHLYQQLWMRSTKAVLKKHMIAFKISAIKSTRTHIAFRKMRMKTLARALFAWCQTSARLAKFSHLLLRSTFTYMRNSFRTWRIQTEIMLKFPHYVEILQAIIRRREVQDTAILFHNWQLHCQQRSCLQIAGHICMRKWKRFLKKYAMRSWTIFLRGQLNDRELEMNCLLRLQRKTLRRWNLLCRYVSSQYLLRDVFFRNQQGRALRLALRGWREGILSIRMILRSAYNFDQRCRKYVLKIFRAWFQHCGTVHRVEKVTEFIDRKCCEKLMATHLSSWMQQAKFTWNRWRRLESHQKYQQSRRLSNCCKAWLDVVKESAEKCIDLIKSAAERSNIRFKRLYLLTWYSIVRRNMIVESSAAKKTFLRACRVLDIVFRGWIELVYKLYQKREKLEHFRTSIYLRSCYAASSKCMCIWKDRVLGIKRIRTFEDVLKWRSEKHTASACFAEWRGRSALNHRRQRFLNSLSNRWIVRSKHTHFRAWFLKYRFEKNLLMHVKAWNMRDTLGAFNTWFALLQKQKAISATKLLPKSDFYITYRRLRKWQYAVELRKSNRLRVGLFQIRYMNSIRLKRRTLQTFAECAYFRKHLFSIQDALSRRILKLKCRNTTILIRNHASRAQKRRKSLWTMMNRLAFSLMKWGWILWRTWMKNKKRTQQALNDVMDDF